MLFYPSRFLPGHATPLSFPLKKVPSRLTISAMAVPTQNALFQYYLILSVKLFLIGSVYPVIRNSIYLQSIAIENKSNSPLLAAVVQSSWDPLGSYSYFFSLSYCVRIVEFRR